jgi:hypothetical protein
MQKQKIKLIRAAPLQGFFRRHAKIPGEIRRLPERGIGEAGIAAGALSLPFVKIMSDRPDEAILRARKAGQRFAQQIIRRARAIDIGGDESADAARKSVADQKNPAFIRERFAEIHKAPAIPGAKSSSRNIHARSLSADGPVANRDFSYSVYATLMATPPQSEGVFFVADAAATLAGFKGATSQSGSGGGAGAGFFF